MKLRFAMKTRALLTGIAALFLATGAAHATEECDTTHTSDMRRIFKCGDVCVHIMGNPPSRYLTFDGVKDAGMKDDKIGSGRFRLTFKWKINTASLNGKQCKELPQTYDYEKQK